MKKLFCFLFFLFFLFSTASAEEFRLTEELKTSAKEAYNNHKSLRHWFKFDKFIGESIKFYSEKYDCTVYFVPFVGKEKQSPHISTKISFSVFFQTKNGKWKLWANHGRKDLLRRFPKAEIVLLRDGY